MKTSKIVIATLLAAMGASSFAQMDYGDQLERDRQARRDQRQEQRLQAERQQRWDQHRVPQAAQVPQAAPYTSHDGRRYYNNGQQYSYNYDRNYDHNRNYGQYYNRSPRYAVGAYAPSPYWRNHRYYVNDWRARHLYAPPYGYQWVETDTGELLLVALATGLIANVILASR